MNNNSFTFGQQFIEFIKYAFSGQVKVASGGKELCVRCKYCEDSSDPTHGHMYIKIPQDKNDVPLFNCFKCHTSGIIDSRTLIDWGIYDPIIGGELDKLSEGARKNKNFFGYNREWYALSNYAQNNKLSEYKLNYINRRLGTNFTCSDCLSNKIILNLKEVLDYNNIQEYTRHPNILSQLNDNFIGFLSLDNNFVNLRRICDEGIVYESIDKRYINYNIHAKKDNTEKMYVLPTLIDLTIPTRINIHIAEGPFDILSIKYNLRNNEPGIYAAITGSGYKGLVIHLITTFKIFYFDLHVYPDNDQYGNSKMINELMNLIRPYGATLYEHRNLYENEKDFGIPIDRISERIYVYK